jgi:hypothetical protein
MRTLDLLLPDLQPQPGRDVQNQKKGKKGKKERKEARNITQRDEEYDEAEKNETRVLGVLENESLTSEGLTRRQWFRWGIP